MVNQTGQNNYPNKDQGQRREQGQGQGQTPGKGQGQGQGQGQDRGREGRQQTPEERRNQMNKSGQFPSEAE